MISGDQILFNSFDFVVSLTRHHHIILYFFDPLYLNVNEILSNFDMKDDLCRIILILGSLQVKTSGLMLK